MFIQQNIKTYPLGVNHNTTLIYLGQVHYDNSFKNGNSKNYLNRINNDNINQNENLIYGYHNVNASS